jgi:hypothetical protein
VDYPGFIGETYTSRSLAVAGERCVNLFPEAVRGNGATARAPLIYYPTSGHKRVWDLGNNAPIRALFYEPGMGRAFAVASGNFFELFKDGTFKVVGVGLSDGPTGIVTNSIQLLIVANGGAHIFDLNTSSMQAIVNPPFDDVSVAPAFMDNYFFVSPLGTRTFFRSALNDGTSWDSNDEETKSTYSDPISGFLSNTGHGQLLIFGTRSLEPWYDSGDNNNPFLPITGSVVAQGTEAPQSITWADNTAFFLGSDSLGTCIVYRLNGYTPTRISNHAIEWAMQQYPRISDAVAFAYQEGGHTFYHISFPSGGKIIEQPGGIVSVLPGGATWVYDCATNMWHERCRLDGGAEKMDRALFHMEAFGWHVIAGGDTTGHVYRMDRTYLDDAGSPLLHLRSAPVLNDERCWLYLGPFELDVQTGLSALDDGTGHEQEPHVIVNISRDGGFTWGPDYHISLGKVGQFKQRVRKAVNGRGRLPCFRVWWTDPVDTALINAYLQVTKGAQ